jgi:inositol oxygenase
MSSIPAAQPTPAGDGVAATENRSRYRDYDQPGIDRVRTFYRNNHTHQTYAFVQEKRAKWLKFDQREMTPWEGLDFLNTLVDESDPDIELPQISHLLQTAEAIRADGHPDWFVLTGFIHDLGKVLCLFGEPQWAVVGDTFPVGCKFSDKVVYPEFFTLTAPMRVTTPTAACIAPAAGWIACACHGATTSICTSCLKTACPSRRCT